MRAYENLKIQLTTVFLYLNHLNQQVELYLIPKLYKMKDSSLHLLCFYLLLSTLMPCLKGSTIVEQPDPLATATYGNTRELIRVEKKAQVGYIYRIAGNYFKPFPQLIIEVDLPFSQFVYIKYLITVALESHIVTRLMIDGVENRDFRVKTGNTVYATNAQSDQVYLQKGTHTIKVQYRTPSNYENYPWTQSNWNGAILKLRYYKPGRLIPPTQTGPNFLTKKLFAQDDYQFLPNNKWYQLSNMLVLLQLPQQQQVQFRYHIVTKTNPQCQLSTRIKIDNQVNKQFNGMSGNNEVHQISMSGGKVKMSKGAHIVQLEYRTTGKRNVKDDMEQQVAYMAITYQA